MIYERNLGRQDVAMGTQAEILCVKYQNGIRGGSLSGQQPALRFGWGTGQVKG